MILKSNYCIVNGITAFTESVYHIQNLHDLSCLQSAVKLSTTALAKHPKDQLLRCLRGYALTHTGKKDEATLVNMIFRHAVLQHAKAILPIPGQCKFRACSSMEGGCMTRQTVCSADLQ